VCEQCNTKVTDLLSEDLTPKVWIRTPLKVSGLINPHALTLMQTTFKIKTFKIVQWLIDTTYNPRNVADLNLRAFEEMGVSRGYNFFFENFELCIQAIRTFLFRYRGVLRKRERNPNYILEKADQTIDDLAELMLQDANTVRTQYIAVPNKSMMIIESTATGTYIDPIVVAAKDAINMVTGIDTSLFVNQSQRLRENRVAKILLKLSEYYSSYISTALVKKGGAFRRQVYGFRTHMSMRAVITALTKPHKYNELHLPWGRSLVTFYLHISNELFRRGYQENEIHERISRAHFHYDPLIREIFDTILADYGGEIPFYWNRNPSLHRGSCELMMVTQIKSDIDDYTISHPATNVAAFNADYDGDQMTGVVLDKYQARLAAGLRPHHSVADLNKVNKIGNQIALPRPFLYTVFKWWRDADRNRTPEQEKFLQALYD